MTNKAKYTFVFSGICILLILIFTLFGGRTSSVKREEAAVETGDSTELVIRDRQIAKYPSPLHIQKKVVSDKLDLFSADLNHGYDLEPFNGYSDNEETLKLIAYLDKNPGILSHESIEVKNAERNNELYFQGKKVFAAPYIYTFSMSENEIIAVEAISTSEYPTYKNSSIDYDPDEKFFPVSYGEIWLIEPNQTARRISPKFINASRPRISSNGRKVAFTANAIDKTNSLILNEFIVVYDLVLNQVDYFNSNNSNKDHYSIVPLMWINGDKVLRVIEDSGETGGHAQVGYIEFR